MPVQPIDPVAIYFCALLIAPATLAAAAFARRLKMRRSLVAVAVAHGLANLAPLALSFMDFGDTGVWLSLIIPSATLAAIPIEWVVRAVSGQHEGGTC